MLQPVLFVSHGSPMLALQPGIWGEALATFAKGLTGVKAVLVVSAHWEDPQPLRLTGAAAPATLHDFSGFPPELDAITYPAPGDPALAERIRQLLEAASCPAVMDVGCVP